MTTTNAFGTQPTSKIYVPTFTNISNSGTFSNIQSFYTTPDLAAGVICQLWTTFTFTPTNASCSFSISIPFGSAFAGSGKANFTGGTCFDVGTGALFSNFNTVDSAAGTIISVAMTINAGAVSASNRVQMCVAYEVQ